MTGLRFIGSVHAIAVDRARADIGKIAVPDLIGVLRQFDPLQLLFAVFVENADLYFGGVGGKECEIGALSVPGCASRVREAFSALRRCGVQSWSFRA